MRYLGTALLLAALLGLLGASLYYAFGIWNAVDTGPMPSWMYAAIAGGIFFSLLIGCGLMALVFYSNRHGYDDRAATGDRD
jgi:hypothetical protein